MKDVYTGVIVIVVLVASFMTVKKVSPVSWGWWGTTNVSAGVALKGSDPVAYFETASTIAGDPAHSYEWADATWQFSSAENRELFAVFPLAAPHDRGEQVEPGALGHFHHAIDHLADRLTLDRQAGGR